jgi:hypothetical protein
MFYCSFFPLSFLWLEVKEAALKYFSYSLIATCTHKFSGYTEAATLPVHIWLHKLLDNCRCRAIVLKNAAGS